MKKYKMMLGVAVVAGFFNLAVAGNVDAGESGLEPETLLPDNFIGWDYKNKTFASIASKIESQKKLLRRIKSDKNNYVIAFFFSAKNKDCQKMGVELYRLRQLYGLNVIAYSVDGTSLDEFPKSISGDSLVENLMVDKIPSVYAIGYKGKDRGKISMLSYGLTSSYQLIDRMANL